MNTRILAVRLALATLLGAALTGCVTETVRTTTVDPIVQGQAPASEELLMDVGVGVFDPGVENLDDDEIVTSPAVRRAEARYIPYTLSQTLQSSGNWGVVRVIPDRRSEMDVWVDGEILESDGEHLKVTVTVTDASGERWYTRTYVERASKYAYEDRLRRREPFQGLYNRIANDLLEYRRANLDHADIRRIRTITGLKFARAFSPEAFGEHLEVDRQGDYHIKRLPAENDPILQRIERIRERDYMFVDTLQEYYGSFARQMSDPYREWRRESYREAEALRELKSQAAARTIGGVLAILGGVLAQGSDSRVARSAGAVGIGAGAYMIKSGIDKNSEAQIHAEALKELSASLNAEIQPHTITLEDRQVTLSGTVEDQYEQWREILQEIYRAETGGTKAPANDTQ